MNHLGEAAELYALGALDAAERERVDTHVATCDLCLRRLGEAERAVAGLVDAPVFTSRRERRWPLALATGLGFACAASLVVVAGLHRDVDSDGELIDRLVSSHFAHVQFQTPAGAPIGAKVIYERNGAWYAVVATGAPAWRAVIITTAGARISVPQPFARRGSGSVLTIDDPQPVRTIELDDAAGSVVATARPLLDR